MKQKSSLSTLLLLGAYIGTVFGVGMYSLPYVLERSGLPLFCIFLVIISAVVYFVNALFADVVLRSEGDKRFLGYIKEFIGIRTERLFFFITLLGFWGTFLIFLIVWGKFAAIILTPFLPFPALAYSMLLFIITLFVICSRARTIEWLDVVMLFGVCALFVILAIAGFPHMHGLPIAAHGFIGGLLPYGALVFALWGVGIIPEIVNQAHKDRVKVKRVLLWGVIVTALAYLAFALLVASISGGGTTKEAITGLSSILGRVAVVFGSLIGIVTIFLSYNNLGWVSRSMLMHDYGYDRFKALSLIFLPPLVLLLFGITNITTIISINGAVLLGLQGIMILALYTKSHKAPSQKVGLFNRPVSHRIAYTAMVILALGVVFELVKSLLQISG